jgi:uncharacterized coiled-coil protein SlyX
MNAIEVYEFERITDNMAFQEHLCNPAPVVLLPAASTGNTTLSPAPAKEVLAFLFDDSATPIATTTDEVMAPPTFDFDFNFNIDVVGTSGIPETVVSSADLPFVDSKPDLTMTTDYLYSVVPCLQDQCMAQSPIEFDPDTKQIKRGGRRRGKIGTSKKPIMVERQRIHVLDAQWPEHILRHNGLGPLKRYIAENNLNSQQVQQLKDARRRYRGRMYTSQSRRTKQSLQAQLTNLEANSRKQKEEIARLSSTLASTQATLRDAIKRLKANGIFHNFDEQYLEPTNRQTIPTSSRDHTTR